MGLWVLVVDLDIFRQIRRREKLQAVHADFVECGQASIRRAAKRQARIATAQKVAKNCLSWPVRKTASFEKTPFDQRIMSPLL